MIEPARGTRGMAVAPHGLAAQAALAVLRDGGNAVEAMLCAAATIAVVYPHMNSIGGDAFWLISVPGQAVRAIDACGAAAGAASIDAYAERGITGSIPFRDGAAALTVAGTISGWDLAHQFSMSALQGRLPLARLLADALHYASAGVPVTRSQHANTGGKLDELLDVPGFAQTFLDAGQVPAIGSLFRQPRMAATLEHLARAGLDDFYRGDLGVSIAHELEAAGSPLRRADLAAHQAQWRTPLELAHSAGTAYNMTPPTQGLVSLLILGMLDRLGAGGMDPLGADFVHAAVESTKRAFAIRDRHITDPAHMPMAAQQFLDAGAIDQLAGAIDMDVAAPWGRGKGPADTIWMGVIDGEGRAVSFIQSIYHEFGSGIVLPSSGINWQNRGCSFSLAPGALNPLQPGRKPFHTLNPALARLGDGRTMVYGNMGGDGQPQTQSAVFTRTVMQGMSPQAAISAPRWLLGRTWGRASESLKLESRFSPAVIDELRRRGHDVELVGEYDETVGHAGAIVRYPDGTLEGGADPRSDGCVAAW